MWCIYAILLLFYIILLFGIFKILLFVFEVFTAAFISTFFSLENKILLIKVLHLVSSALTGCINKNQLKQNIHVTNTYLKNVYQGVSDCFLREHI